MELRDDALFERIHFDLKRMEAIQVTLFYFITQTHYHILDVHYTCMYVQNLKKTKKPIYFYDFVKLDSLKKYCH